jgi:SAM-dependent methyltransferase
LDEPVSEATERPIALVPGPTLRTTTVARGEGLGRIYTPPELARHVAQTAAAALGRRACAAADPSVGRGALLVPLAGCGIQLCGVDVDVDAVDEARRRLPSARLSVGDGLAAGTLPQARFDLVLGNPPWVSFSGRQAAALAAETSARYAREYRSWRGWPCLHGPFLEAGGRLLAPGGVMAMLVPRSVCTHRRYGAVRGVLRELGEVWAQDLGEGVFAGVTESTALVLLRRLTNAAGAATVGATAAGAPPAPPLAPDKLAVLRDLPRVPPHTFGDPGVHTGNAASLLICDQPTAGTAPIRIGRDITPYRLFTPTHWLLTDPALPRDRYCRLDPTGRWHHTRLLLRQTAERPIAAVHDPPTWFRNSILACYGIDGIDDDTVAAWLNSSTVAAWHRATAADARQRTFPQVKVAHLQNLPLPPKWPVELAELGRQQRWAGYLEARQRRIDEMVARAYGVEQ